MSRTKRLLEIIWHGIDTNKTDLAISREIRKAFPKVTEDEALSFIRVQRKQKEVE